MFFDSHAHLDYHLFDEDRQEMIERAWAAGVEAIVTIGIDPSSCQRAVALAEKYDKVYAAVGLHPTDAVKQTGETFPELEKWAAHPKVVAVGETGLDYHWPDSPHDIQQDVFRKTIRLACRLDLPLIIHNRKANKDIIRILEEEKQQGMLSNLRGIMHCFSGDREMLERSLELGFFISFAGNLTYKKSELPELASVVPENRLLVETDSPFLPPVPYRGKRNESAYVRFTAEKLAEIRNMDVEALGRITTANARLLFKV